jgi:DNA polymerase I-like protein with 3'-5' exonuclease and polymerase domains
MIATVDFETFAIEPRPDYPPEPVGVAIRLRGRSKYWAWGHPLKNNCSKRDAEKALREAFSHPCVFHNAPFDLEVAQEHFPRLRMPAEVHDTRILAWLDDPNRKITSLKPLSELILGLPPTEQDDLRDWIRDHVPGARRLRAQWGRFIALAPGDLVGRYAKGDVDRTWGLFQKWRHLTRHPHYEREMRLIPVILDMGRRGIPIDEAEVERQCVKAKEDLDRVERWIRRRLRAPSLDLDKDLDLAAAIEKEKKVTEFVLTATGQDSVSIANLREYTTDPALVGALDVRNLIKTPLKNHLRHWRGKTRAYCSWNSVPFERFGARTGRLSSTPNLQNVAARDKDPRALGCTLRAIELPRPRKAVAGSLVGADYSGQELRILAHFAGGEMLQGYLDDPSYDIHGLVQDSLHSYGFERHQIKNALVFPRIYGAGIGRVASELGVSYPEAQKIRTSLNAVVPGIQRLDDLLQKQSACTTWGGRENEAESGWEYKLLNTLIQGSAGDQLKEAMIRFDEDDRRESELVLTVHDEIVIEGPKREAKRLRRHMEAPEFRVPMIAEAKAMSRWEDLKT